MLTNHTEIMAKFNKSSGYSKPEVGFCGKKLKFFFVFADIITRRLSNLRITIPGGCDCKLFFKLLLTNHNEIMAKFKKFPGIVTRRLIGTCLGLWFEGKKMGSSKNPFCNLQVSLPGNCYAKNLFFANISSKTNYFSKIFWGVTKGLCTIKRYVYS